MVPWFIATEKFGPKDADKWRAYIEWSGLFQLTELVSLDSILCGSVLGEIKKEYWPHIVNEDFMLNFFVDLDFLKLEIAGMDNYNLLCVFRNPSQDLSGQAPQGFDFVGYDLVDKYNDVSALSNCGGFPDVFSNSELSKVGLLDSFARAVEVQTQLLQLHPEESHTNCNLWAVFRGHP